MQLSLVRRTLNNERDRRGFTIVELLIVVVVIAILAAITIIAYNGITQRAKDSSLQSSLSQLAKRLESAKYDSSSEIYPSTLANLNTNVPAGSFNYSVSVSGKGFCLTGVGDSGTTWYVTNYQLQPTQGSCVTADGLVGWWLMNGDGSDASGSGGLANFNAQIPTVGQNGQQRGAYTIAAASASAPVSSLPTGSAPRTVLAWVYATAYPATGTWAMVNSYGTTAQSAASALSIHPSGRVGFNGQSNDFISTTVLPLNSWHLIGYTVSGTQVSVVYDGSVSNGSLSNTLSTASSSVLNIGNWFGVNRWNGTLDDMRIYNRVLTQTELQAIFSAGAL